jgi:Spy/CpxP family protein refolding chaperone
MTNRLAVTLMLLAAAVAGGIVALVLDRALHRSPAVAARPQSPHARRGPPMSNRRSDPHDWLARELRLSPTQRARLDSLMNRQRDEFRALREETRPRFDSITARTRRALDSVFTPDQRRKMDSITSRRPSS